MIMLSRPVLVAVRVVASAAAMATVMIITYVVLGYISWPLLGVAAGVVLVLQASIKRYAESYASTIEET